MDITLNCTEIGTNFQPERRFNELLKMLMTDLGAEGCSTKRNIGDTSLTKGILAKDGRPRTPVSSSGEWYSALDDLDLHRWLVCKETLRSIHAGRQAEERSARLDTGNPPENDQPAARETTSVASSPTEPELEFDREQSNMES